jgi:ABC-type multidrug transport system permease subunit
MACLWKQNLSYWRNPQYTVVRFFFSLVVALMFGTIFWRLGGRKSRQQDLFNAMGSMYAAVLFMGISYSSSVQPVVAVERTVFYRERAAGMYSALPYAFGQVVVELPYVLVQSVVYGVIVYAMIGFQWDVKKFCWYIYFMYFTLLYFTYYGMLAVGLTPSYNIASIVSSFFYGVWNLFSGFVIARPVRTHLFIHASCIPFSYILNWHKTHGICWCFRRCRCGGGGTRGRAPCRGRCTGWWHRSSATSRSHSRTPTCPSTSSSRTSSDSITTS